MPQIEKLVSQLTLEEKAALCSGISNWETTPISRLGIPSLFMADGPHGLRREREGAEVYSKRAIRQPASPAVTLASSWNRSLSPPWAGPSPGNASRKASPQSWARGLTSRERPCAEEILNISVKTPPHRRAGRRFHQGSAGDGVGTSLKHYAANSQELPAVDDQLRS